MNGATIKLRCSTPLLGELLHRLEYHADVFVIGIERLATSQTVLITVRSDIFPAEWNGHEGTPATQIDKPGILEWGINPGRAKRRELGESVGKLIQGAIDRSTREISEDIKRKMRARADELMERAKHRNDSEQKP